MQTDLTREEGCHCRVLGSGCGGGKSSSKEDLGTQVKPIKFNLISSKGEDVFGVRGSNKGRDLREVARKLTACLELLNRSYWLDGEVLNQRLRRTVNMEWKDLLKERGGSFSSELIPSVKAAAIVSFNPVV